MCVCVFVVARFLYVLAYEQTEWAIKKKKKKEEKTNQERRNFNENEKWRKKPCSKHIYVAGRVTLTRPTLWPLSSGINKELEEKT